MKLEFKVLNKLLIKNVIYLTPPPHTHTHTDILFLLGKKFVIHEYIKNMYKQT